MNKVIFRAEYAGHPVYYEFLHPGTRLYFGKHLKRAVEKSNPDIKVTEALIEKVVPFYPSGTKKSYIEYKLMIQQTGKFLLRYHCCIFHCVSFVYKGYAWLLTAPSGTGKTTQYLNWNRLYPDEIVMISGDMPVLVLNDNSVISVHPTSWNGKENIGNQITAPLGGVICLEQGNKNCMHELKVKDGLIPLFSQFMAIPETEEEAESLSSIMENIFKNYPSMKFVNVGDDKSTLILRNTINRILEKRYEI